MLVPGQKIREYERCNGRTDSRVREQIENIVEGEYKLRQAPLLGGVQTRSYDKAKQCEGSEAAQAAERGALLNSDDEVYRRPRPRGHGLRLR